MRRAMAGKMPDTVLNNPKKGRQAADVIPRLREFPMEMNEALGQLRDSPLARECLNLSRMEEVWRRIQEEASPNLTQLSNVILLKGPDDRPFSGRL